MKDAKAPKPPRRHKLFPTRKQWHGWSLPSKLGAIGTYSGITLGLVGLGISLGVLLLPAEPRTAGAVLSLATQRVVNEDSTNKVAIVLTFINSGDVATTADVQSQLLLSGKPATIENRIPTRQDFPPRQPTPITFWLPFSSDGYTGLWTGSIPLRVEFTFTYPQHPDRLMRYEFVGVLDPQARQIETVRNVTEPIGR